MPDARLADLTRRYRQRVKEYRYARKRIHVLRAAIKRRRAELAKSSDPGAKAVQFLLRRVGWTEKPPGSNDAPFLANWRKALNMGWMRGEPWCGFACQAAYHYGAGKTLPADTPSTIAIANRARRGDGFTAVPFDHAKTGDLVVFNFGSGGPKHVGLAVGPSSGGSIKCVEGNTSSSNSGSQSNGGGIFLRTRPRNFVHTVARPK